MFGQEPTAATPGLAGQVITALQHLGWVDVTALSVLGVFFVLGIFRGLLWQISRIATLLVAYWSSVRFGRPLADALLQWTWDPPGPHTLERYEGMFYLACVLVFLGTVVALSLTVMMLQKLIHRAGLSFYNRLFGGLLGVATGAVVVLLGMTGVYLFFPHSQMAMAAGESHSLRLSRRVMDEFAGVLPPELFRILPSPRVDAADGPGGRWSDDPRPGGSRLPGHRGGRAGRTAGADGAAGGPAPAAAEGGALENPAAGAAGRTNRR